MKKKQRAKDISKEEMDKLFSAEDEPHRKECLDYLRILVSELENNQNASMYTAIGIILP